MSINSTGYEKVNSSLRELWSEWLNEYDWNWWTTLTFRNKVTKKAANKKWNRWLRAIEEETEVSPGYFRVTENQERNVLHFHALMLGVEHLRRLTFMDRWFEIAGYARIYPYDSKRGANHYLTKYISKELSDYKFGGCILKT